MAVRKQLLAAMDVEDDRSKIDGQVKQYTLGCLPNYFRAIPVQGQLDLRFTQSAGKKTFNGMYLTVMNIRKFLIFQKDFQRRELEGNCFHIGRFRLADKVQYIQFKCK
jgi:hypothetical protein